MSVTDTFPPDAPNSMGIIDAKPGPLQTLSDFTIFATGYKTLHVQKDILAYAIGETRCPFHKFAASPAAARLYGRGGHKVRSNRWGRELNQARP